MEREVPVDVYQDASALTHSLAPSSKRDAKEVSISTTSVSFKSEIEGKTSGERPHSLSVVSNNTQLYITFTCICILVFSASLDATIVTTSLPTITANIGGETKYVWIANVLSITSTAVLPTIGQLSNIFGRKSPLIAVCSLFIIGCAIAGAARNAAELIAARIIQGLGTGGMIMLTELITSDLVPVQERPKYLGIFGATATIATMLGPVIGGALAQTNWRWVFLINIPMVGTALIVMLFFVQMRYNREPTWKAAVKRIDYFGGMLFIASIVAIMLGLIMGGVTDPWSSWRVVVPLTLGFVGWAVFHVYQVSPLCKEPTLPSRLFTNRTSSMSFLMTFLQAMLLSWLLYFLPIYFQAVKGTSPVTSGVDLLPFNAFFLPAAIVSGGLMTKLGVFRPLHAVSHAFLALGIGLFALLNADSSRALWVIFQLFAAMGIGFGMSTLLPTIQAALPESDVAAACATYSFLRNFGQIWGITIPSVIFNSQVNGYLGSVSNPQVQAQLANSAAYSFAGQGVIPTLPEPVRSQVISVYTFALQRVWEVGAAFAAVGILLVFIEKHVVLRAELDTEFGLDNKKQSAEGDMEKGTADDAGSNEAASA